MLVGHASHPRNVSMAISLVQRNPQTDLVLDVNNRRVDMKMRQLSDHAVTDQDRKLAVGIIRIFSAMGRASGSRVEISFDYAIQKTDAGGVCIVIIKCLCGLGTYFAFAHRQHDFG